MKRITLTIENGGDSNEIDDILKSVAKYAHKSGGVTISIYDRNAIYSFGTHFDITEEGLVEDESKYWNKDIAGEVV